MTVPSSVGQVSITSIPSPSTLSHYSIPKRENDSGRVISDIAFANYVFTQWMINPCLVAERKGNVTAAQIRLAPASFTSSKIVRIFADKKTTPEELVSWVKRFPGLRSLKGSSHFTNEHLAALVHFRGLQSLSLISCQKIFLHDLAYLHELPCLKKVDLSYCENLIWEWDAIQRLLSRVDRGHKVHLVLRTMVGSTWISS